jgi:hypothetical protein
MKVRITEEQFEKLQEIDSYKNMIFKYWDKFGPGISKEMIKLFGISFGKSSIRMTDLQRWLREYLGEEKIKESSKSFLENKEHHINDCGGYDFYFTFNHSFEDGQYLFDITVDDIRGTVILIMTDGTIHKIKDARNEEFGWEIENEVEDCIHDYISKNLEDKTGVPFVFEKLTYKSDM